MQDLLRLPPEILVFILMYFNSPPGIPILLSLCLTSRQLYALAQPILFRTYVRRYHSSNCHKYSDISDGLEPLLSFTRTILSRPDLRSYVRQIILDTSDWKPLKSENWAKALPQDTLGLLASSVQKLPINNKASFLSAIVGTKAMSLVALLWAQTPNLQRLQMALKGGDWMELSALITRLPIDAFMPMYLSNLRDLSFRGQTEEPNRVSTKFISQFLRLPRLEHLSISSLSVSIVNDSEPAPLLQSLHLTSLSLSECYMDMEYLASIVRSCKALKKFMYEAAFEDSSEIFPILYSQKETLETVVVDTNLTDLNMAHVLAYPDIDMVGSFTNLQHLEIEQCFLDEEAELPSSLRYLTLRGCEYPVYNLLNTLMLRGYDDLESLEMVILQPLFSPPNGLLGLPRRFGRDDFYGNHRYYSAFEEACKRLDDEIVSHALFDLHIKSEEWMEYRARLH